MFAVIGSLIVESWMQSADQTLYSPITYNWFFLQILYLKCLHECLWHKSLWCRWRPENLGVTSEEMREWLNKGHEETKNISNARIQKELFQDTNEQRAERSGETMSKLSEREWEQYLGNAKKKDDKGEWQLPAGLGQMQCRISNKARGRQCILLSFFEKL